MTDHPWDPTTGYCKKCGVRRGWHAEECLAGPTCTGFMHRLAKRRMEVEAAGHGLDWPAGDKIVVEGPPKPPESA